MACVEIWQVLQEYGMILKRHSVSSCEPFWQESFIGSKVFVWNETICFWNVQLYDYAECWSFSQTSNYYDRSLHWRSDI